MATHEVRFVRRASEFRITEVSGFAASPWKGGGVWVCGEERPDVEVFDAVLTIDEMQGCALAQGYADEPLGEHRIAGLSPEEIYEISTRDLSQTDQIFTVDPLV